MPRTVDHHERRERIASALMRVAADRGLDAVSLRHVAAEAGVTSGMVQHYFPTKEAMMDFAMRSAGARYAARMDEAIAGLDDGATAREVVGGILRALLPLDESRRADGRVALAFQSYAATRRAAAQGLAQDNAQLHEFVADQVRSAGSSAAEAAAINPEHAATALLALGEGLGVLMLSSGLPAEAALAALEAQLDATLGRNQEGSHSGRVRRS